jgi:hypothetical protein
LSAQRQFVFEQQSQPFGVLESTSFRLVFEFLEPLGQAMETERVQLVECRMSEQEEFPSMVVAGTAQIGVIEQGGGRIVLGGRVVGFASEQRGDALAIEDADLEGAG